MITSFKIRVEKNGSFGRKKLITPQQKKKKNYAAVTVRTKGIIIFHVN